MTGSDAEDPDKHENLVDVLEDARSLGLLGPGPVDRQLGHATDLARAIGGFAGRFLDLGSGGGLPGLVLVQEFPTAQAVLLDAHQRRCEFLRRAIERLQLEDRVEVVAGRAELLARSESLRAGFDLVVARSFGAPAVTAECAVGFLKRGGTLVVTEPPETDVTNSRWPEAGLARLGFGPAVEIRHGETGAVRIEAHGLPGEQWPRRVGVPTKRPLW